MDEDNSTMTGYGGLDRRTLLKRGAVVGGAAVWATPVVQSLAAPAWAAGSPGCTHVYRFKYDVEEGKWDSGAALGQTCVPEGYGDADPVLPGGHIPGHTGAIAIIVSDDGRSAEISLPPGCVLLDGDAKAGAKNNLECEDAVPAGTEGGRNVYEVTLPSKDISHIAGVICCS